MLVAEINGKGVEIKDFQMSFGQTDIPTFDVTLPTRAIAGQDLYLDDIAIYQDDLLIIDGIIKSPFPYPQLPESISNPLFTSLKCDNNLGRLGIEGGLIVHFQDTLVSVALAQLLAGTTLYSWILNDTSTLQDVEITVDVRGKETIWSQIQEVCSQSRYATFVRYGGFNGTEYLLDIGYFRDRKNSPKAVWGDNIIAPPRFQEASQEPIKYIRPISGASADTPVDLDDALNIDATLDNASQDYQILLGQGIIRNNTITKGVAVTRSFNTIKTENDSAPSQAEKDQVALALYRTAAEEMEASQESISLTVKITSADVPNIHDAIWLESKIFEEKYDLYTEQFSIVESFDISGYFRITGITADLRERYEVYNPYTEQFIKNGVYELELVKGDKRVVKSETDILLEKTEKTSQFDNLEAIATGGVLGISNVTVSHSGVSANCNFSGVNTGRTFSFTVPTAPAGATDVTITIKNISPTSYLVKTTTYGTIGGSHVLCVQNETTNDWDITDSATIIVTCIFT